MPLAFFVAVFAVGVYVQEVDGRLAARSVLTAQTLAASDDVFSALDEQSQIINRVREGKERAGDPRTFENLSLRLSLSVARLRNLVSSAGRVAEERVLAPYADATPQVEALLQRAFALARIHDERAWARIESTPRYVSLLRGWRDAKTAFDATLRDLLIEEYRTASDSLRVFRRIEVALICCGALATLIAAMTLGRVLVRRLQVLAATTRALAKGEQAPQAAGTDEIALVDQLVHSLTNQLGAVAEERQRALEAYKHEHDVAATLQSALLPKALPQMTGLHVYTAYMGADGTTVGGDWYDVFALGERRIGLSMGDVAGHGVAAAARMSAIRQSIRTAARGTTDPGAVLRLVNQTLCADDDESLVSALFATVDLATGTIRYANAGHPPPLIVSENMQVSVLDSGDVILGVDPERTFESIAAELPPSCALIFYTDGLIEHGRDVVVGSAELLVAAAAEFHNPSHNPAEGVQRRVLRNARLHDDSAVMVLCFDSFGVASPGSWTWDFDTHDEAAATRVKRAIMRRVRDELRDVDSVTFEIVYGELVGNVVRHTPGRARVTLEPDGVLTVTDEGAPFSLCDGTRVDSLAEDGRGMDLIRSLVSDIEVRRLSHGNEIRVRIARKPANRSILSG